MTSDQLVVPWQKVFAEGVAIVVSILLAFGIQAWWERRQERLELHSDLSALAEEFQATRTRLEGSLEWHQRIERAAREIEQRLPTGGSSASVSIPDTLIAVLLAMPTLDLPTADLQHLQSAVDFSAIPDPELRQRLTLFTRIIEDQNEGERRGSELVGPALVLSLNGRWIFRASGCLCPTFSWAGSPPLQRPRPRYRPDRPCGAC